MVERLEKRRVATESGGDETWDETGGPGDETGDKTAATAGDERDGGDLWDIVCDGRLPSLFGEHCEILRWRTLRKMLKRWWERLEKWRMPTESGGDKTATRLGTRPAVPTVPGTRAATRRGRRMVTNEMAATGGVMYTDEGELEFNEDEMAALEGQHLVAEFRCGIY